MPNQIKQTQAGFLSIVIIHIRFLVSVDNVSRLFSVSVKGKLRFRTAQAKRYDLSERISTGIRRTDDQAGPLSEQSADCPVQPLSGQEYIVTRTTAA
jgi:hypothetical protein